MLMKSLFAKPLFWSNLAAFLVTGFVIASVANGWTNPAAAPVGGSGAISADSLGNIGIGTTPTTDKLTINGYLRFLTGGGLRFADGTVQTSAQRSAFFTPPAPAVYTPGVTNVYHSYTFTVPAGVTTIYVTSSGAGGGGGGGAAGTTAAPAGGSGGGHAGLFTYKKPLTVTPGTVYTVTVSRGGPGGAAGGAVGTNGVAGSGGGNAILYLGATTILSSTGGPGGSGNTAGYPYGGGGGGTPQISGERGGDPLSGTGGRGGNGGMNIFGIGGGGSTGAPANPAIGPYGGGGGGGRGGNINNVGTSGAAGAPGFMLIEW